MSVNVGKVIVASTVAVTSAISLTAPAGINAAAKVKLNKTSVELKVGESFKLKLKGAKAVKFKSSNKKVAKVTAKGNIKAKKAGTATITVTGDNGKTYKCKVTVVKKNQDTGLTDTNIDLGGMEIIIRDWWSPGEDIEPRNEYEAARQKYLDDIQKTYNFKIKEVAISDWGATPMDFIDYVTNGGDDQNYVFALRPDPSMGSAVLSGLMYDLSTLDCLDFSQEKFKRNMLHEQFTFGSSIYAFHADYAEPRTGVYFNKQVLKDAGIDPDDIYDAQKNGTWNWQMFDELMSKVQRDTDGDGVDDVYGLTLNETIMTQMAILSNNGSLISKNKKGKFVNNLDSAETLEALEWCADIFAKYDAHDPEDATWDYYFEEWRSGKVGFLVDQEYLATQGNMLYNRTDFDMGFVMFPKGPKADDYVSLWDDNIYAIPACYDAERAWKIAFAWNKYTDPVPGYKDYNQFIETAKISNYDKRAIKETLPMMEDQKLGKYTFDYLIPEIEIGPDLYWMIGPNAAIDEIVEPTIIKWNEVLDEINSYIK